MDRKRGRRNQPTIEPRLGDRGFAIKKAVASGYRAARTLDISIPLQAQP
jgi:hypothetical protein